MKTKKMIVVGLISFVSSWALAENSVSCYDGAIPPQDDKEMILATFQYRNDTENLNEGEGAYFANITKVSLFSTGYEQYNSKQIQKMNCTFKGVETNCTKNEKNSAKLVKSKDKKTYIATFNFGGVTETHTFKLDACRTDSNINFMTFLPQGSEE